MDEAEVSTAKVKSGGSWITADVKVKVGGVWVTAAEGTPTPGLVIDPPVGPFTELNGAGTADYGQFYHWWDLDADVSREFKKLYYHNHDHTNLKISLYVTDQHVLDNPGKPYLIGESSYPVPYDDPLIIEDCKFYDASAAVPLSLNGTDEANLWVGGHAMVNRIDLRRGAWMGLWTGGGRAASAPENAGCIYSEFTNMSITEQRVGIYIEHDTIQCTFSTFEIEAEETGIISEWWYLESADDLGVHGSCVNTFENFDIEITGSGFGEREGYGITLDSGTFGCTIRNGVIRGGKGIELPNELVYPIPNTVTNVVDENGDPVNIDYHDRPVGWDGQ